MSRAAAHRAKRVEAINADIGGDAADRRFPHLLSTTTATDCDCRKPKPGMLLDAAALIGIDLGAAASWSAIAGATSKPGQAAGCRTIFIDYGYDESAAATDPIPRVTSLGEAVDLIILRAEERSVTDDRTS